MLETLYQRFLASITVTLFNFKFLRRFPLESDTLSVCFHHSCWENSEYTWIERQQKSGMYVSNQPCTPKAKRKTSTPACHPECIWALDLQLLPLGCFLGLLSALASWAQLFSLLLDKVPMGADRIPHFLPLLVHHTCSPLSGVHLSTALSRKSPMCIVWVCRTSQAETRQLKKAEFLPGAT